MSETNCGSEKHWSKNFGSEKKFWQKKIWVDKATFGVEKMCVPKNLGSKKSLVKIGSVTAEIMPILTNVAWTYVS